jgi:hypothetical protein
MMSNLFEVQALRKTSLFNFLVVEFIKLKCMDLKIFIEAIRKSEGIGMPLLLLSISLALKNMMYYYGYRSLSVNESDILRAAFF